MAITDNISNCLVSLHLMISMLLSPFPNSTLKHFWLQLTRPKPISNWHFSSYFNSTVAKCKRVEGAQTCRVNRVQVMRISSFTLTTRVAVRGTDVSNSIHSPEVDGSTLDKARIEPVFNQRLKMKDVQDKVKLTVQGCRNSYLIFILSKTINFTSNLLSICSSFCI